MPGKNIVKIDVEDTFYHVYNRGVAKMDLFRDEDDYWYFESLIERLLSSEEAKNRNNRSYPSYAKEVSVHAYCLMPNHFHFLIKQHKIGAVANFMRSLSTSYAMYFNKKYNRRGRLYESTYRAIIVDKDEYLMHVSRYIHLNPLGFRSWSHSSYQDYLYTPRQWISTDFILDMFSTKKYYLAFVDDYADQNTDSPELERYLGEF